MGEEERTSTSNNEVEDPLGCGREGYIHRTETSRRDLADQNPTHWSPSELEEGCEEEDHDNGNITGWRYGFACHGRVEAHVKANVEHGEALGDGGPKKRLAAAESVGNENQEDATGQHLDDAVNAGGEEGGFGAAEAEVLEQGGGVVVDSVCAC